MKLFILRHGETEPNTRGAMQGWLDETINENGRRLAVLTGRAMKGIRFDHCISSPLARARETAEIILRESGNTADITFDDRLREIGFGDMEGKSLPELGEEGEKLSTDPFHYVGFPNGESIADVCRRTQSFLKELIARNDGKTYLVSTHGCAMRAMINYLLDDPSDYWCGHVPYNCSFTIIEAKDGKARITEMDKVYYDRSLIVDHFSMINKNDFIIRPEEDRDHRAVENLIRESFWNVYRPGCSEHYVIHVLREDPAFVKQLDFVMEQNGRLIGQNMFMKTVIEADDGRTVPVLTMGPICIAPELKRQGYGKKLLDFSLEQASALGFGAVLFEGNIGFYGKSGFTYGREFGIRYHDLPEGADDSFFLCRELIPGYLDGITGVYQTPQGYYVDDADVEEFDKAFPPKEKLRLPGQIF